MKVKVVWHRTETYREEFIIDDATGVEDARQKSKELCDEYDWTDNVIVSAEEYIVSCHDITNPEDRPKLKKRRKRKP